MSMREIEFIVVDDQLADFNRLDCYKRLIDQLTNMQLFPGINLKLLTPTQPSEAVRLLGMEPKAGVIRLCIRDLMLTSLGWEDVEPNIDQLIVDHSIPLILVSSIFGEPSAQRKINNLVARVRSNQGFPPLINFSELAFNREEEHLTSHIVDAAPSIRRITDSALTTFQIFLNQLLLREPDFSPLPNEPISIIHVTDLHFGTAEYPVGSIAQIAHIRETKELPLSTFFAITGDIAHKGMPAEYVLAKPLIEMFFQRGLMKDGVASFPSNRILMTPGNHDICRPLAFASQIQDGLLKDEETDDFKATSPLWHFGFAPFCAFSATLQNTENTWLPKPGFRLNSQYSASGIHFLELNAESYRFPPDALERINEKTFRKTCDDVINAAASIVKGDCLLILLHRYKLESDNRFKILNDMLTTLANRLKVIVLSGHVHNKNIGISTDSRSLLIQGTCLGEHWQEPHQRPGLTYVTLERKDSQVSGCICDRMEYDGGHWQHSETSRFDSALGEANEYIWNKRLQRG